MLSEQFHAVFLPVKVILLEIGLPGIDIDFPNPFEMLSKAFQEAYEWQTETIEMLIILGQDAEIDKGPLHMFYQSNTNLALYLAYLVFGLALILGVFLAKHKRIGEAFIVWFLLSALSSQWIPFVSWLRGTSVGLSKVIASFDTVTTGASLPQPDNPVVGTILFFSAFGVGFLLAGFVTSFEVTTVLLAAWMLPFFALRAIGPRTKKLCNLVWAIGIVGCFLGRPFVTFFIEAGVWMMKTLPFGKTSFGGGIYIIAGYGMATCIIFILIVGCYHAVNAVDGKVAALASGTIAAVIRKTVKVDVDKWRRTNPRPIPVVIQNQKASMGDRGKEAAGEAAKVAAKKAAISAAKKAAAAAV